MLDLNVRYYRTTYHSTEPQVNCFQKTISQQSVFPHGHGILVTTEGPGKLHIYSYGAANLPGHLGFAETTSHGVRDLSSHIVITTRGSPLLGGEGKGRVPHWRAA